MNQVLNQFHQNWHTEITVQNIDLLLMEDNRFDLMELNLIFVMMERMVIAVVVVLMVFVVELEVLVIKGQQLLAEHHLHYFLNDYDQKNYLLVD